VRKQLCQHSADLLRNNPTTRIETAASAAAIARTIAGVLAIDQPPAEPPQTDAAGSASLFETPASTEESIENETSSILDHMAAYMGVPA
jgi:hypothetical protein